MFYAIEFNVLKYYWNMVFYQWINQLLRSSSKVILVTIVKQHMTPPSYQKEPFYFGKYQSTIARIFILLFFQFPFFAAIAITLYAVATLNSTIIAIEGFIIILTYTFKRSQIYIQLVIKYIVPTSYFKNFYRIFEEDIPDDTRALFCLHPHAVFAYCKIFSQLTGIIANMNCGNDKMTNMIGLVSRFIFNIPLLGAILRLYGLDSVDPRNLAYLMKEGKTVGILPGGFEQATLTTPGELRIYVKKRFGFIKYALKYGYTIYPTIVFNQHKQFSTFDYFLWLRYQINKFKFPAVLFMSKWLFFLNPNFQMITVIGKGIKLEKKHDTQESITKSEIHELQTKYIEEIQRLYKKYGHLNENSPLKIY